MLLVHLKGLRDFQISEPFFYRDAACGAESGKSFNPEYPGTDGSWLFDQFEQERGNERSLEKTGADHPTDEFTFSFS